ncbi:hypothetical protein K1719_008876 [Acacia pycnantha]|nr:hypothetical protein K1719_008876 [Acacia pycnantha]
MSDSDQRITTQTMNQTQTMADSSLESPSSLITNFKMQPATLTPPTNSETAALAVFTMGSFKMGVKLQ